LHPDLRPQEHSNPGSSVHVLKRHPSALALPPHALQLARTAHELLALHSAKHNATLKSQPEASNSERKSIAASLLSSTRVSPLDSVPMPTPPGDSEQRGDETVRIDIVPLKRAPREDSDLDRRRLGAAAITTLPWFAPSPLGSFANASTCSEPCATCLVSVALPQRVA
jgi:hypothetical protein